MIIFFLHNATEFFASVQKHAIFVPMWCNNEIVPAIIQLLVTLFFPLKQYKRISVYETGGQQEIYNSKMICKCIIINFIPVSTE